MKLCMFGTGYVGLVTGACLAKVGHRVACIDINEARIARLNQGEVPIYEPGLAPIVEETLADGRLTFTTDPAEGIQGSTVVCIAVGTPPDEDGSADLSHVLAVAKAIGELGDPSMIYMVKSTVPVGTCDKVKATIEQGFAARGIEAEATVVSNPEFLKEGAAIDDCMRPDRIVIGSDSHEATVKIKKLYASFVRNHERFVVTGVRESELTKYAANAMLATRISFMNELSRIAELVGADIEEVRRGIGSDPRIGWSFLYAGAGYGGSCFPKDVKALVRTANQHEYEPRLLNAVEDVNDDQKTRLFELMSQHFGSLAGKHVALWGLAFKPNTDDMREASSIPLIHALLEAGATVTAYDPKATEEAQRIFAGLDGLSYAEHPMAATEKADALVIVTEWKVFWNADLVGLSERLTNKVIFDGRNVLDPQTVAEAGFTYYGMGRGASVASQ